MRFFINQPGWTGLSDDLVGSLADRRPGNVAHVKTFFNIVNLVGEPFVSHVINEIALGSCPCGMPADLRCRRQ
jgi:hypothetical protein